MLSIHEWGDVHTDRLVFVCITTKKRTTREPRISPQLAVDLECFRDECSRRWGHESRSRDHLFASRFGPAEHISRAEAVLALRQMISCIWTHSTPERSRTRRCGSAGYLSTYRSI